MSGREDRPRFGRIDSELRVDAVPLQPSPVIHRTGIARKRRTARHGLKADHVPVSRSHSGPFHLDLDGNGDRFPCLLRRLVRTDRNERPDAHRKGDASRGGDLRFPRDNSLDMKLHRMLIEPKSQLPCGGFLPVPELQESEEDQYQSPAETAPIPEHPQGKRKQHHGDR